MERRELRRQIAQQLETKVMSSEHIENVRTHVLGAEASEEDVKEFKRQLEFVMEPLVKKLRRAQGHGKQTGRLLVEDLQPTLPTGNVMVGSPSDLPSFTEQELVDHVMSHFEG